MEWQMKVSGREKKVKKGTISRREKYQVLVVC